MHTQNLIDSDRARKQYFVHRRGWLEWMRWEYCLSKNPFDNLLRLMFDFGGDNPREFQVSFALLGLSVYLTFTKLLPFEVGWYERNGKKNPLWHEDSMGRSTGFYYFEKHFVVQIWKSESCSGRDWRRFGYSQHFHMPWEWDCVRSEIMHTDLKLRHKDWHDETGVWKETYAYTYVLKSGEIQNRLATVTVDEMEWRWRIFSKLRIGPKKVRRSIWVKFDKEVGERTGSWKGGTTGCGWDIKPGESPRMALRRMELERKFS